MNWYLVLVICANNTAWSCSATTIPQPYPTYEMCLQVGKDTKNADIVRCVAVPK